jgi:hypothetical protein
VFVIPWSRTEDHDTVKELNHATLSGSAGRRRSFMEEFETAKGTGHEDSRETSAGSNIFRSVQRCDLDFREGMY